MISNAGVYLSACTTSSNLLFCRFFSTHLFFFWAKHSDCFYLATMNILKGMVSSTHSFSNSIILLHNADSAELESIHFTSVPWLLPGQREKLQNSFTSLHNILQWDDTRELLNNWVRLIRRCWSLLYNSMAWTEIYVYVNINVLILNFMISLIMIFTGM